MFPAEDNVKQGASGSVGTDHGPRERSSRPTTSGAGDSGELFASPRSRRKASQPAESMDNATEEVVREERDRLLAQKQTQLDQIFNRHDDLVREKFHMENWKSMLEYDPRIAKTDESQVFRDYKADYDLLRTVEPEAGPSRRTRRAANERKSIIEATVHYISAMQLSLPPKPSHQAVLKRKTTLESMEAQSASAVVVEKGKGKQREAASAVEEHDMAVPATRRNGKDKELITGLDSDDTRKMSAAAGDGLTRERTKHQSKSQTASLRSRPSGQLSETPVQNSILVVPRASGVKRRHSTLNEPDPSELLTIRIGQKSTRRQRDPDDQGKAQPQDPASVLQGLEPASARRTLRQRPTNSERITPKPQNVNGQAQQTPEHPPSPQSPSHGVKRIKLIVRKPNSMPTYTNAWQRPDAALHGHSLTALLSSYLPPDRSKQVEKEAGIREREAEFRKAGRFIPGTDLLFGTKLESDELPPLYDPPKRETRDHWDHVINTVAEHHRLRENGELWNGKVIIGKVAEMVKAYWEVQEAKRERIRLQEEKKLRALAKATIKAVVTEWKRAVHHIREQERLKEEEEERRRGQEHLESLLDQSGQILSTQKSRLGRRGTSTGASSMSERLAAWGQDSDDESDRGLESDGSSEPSDADEEEDAEDTEGLDSSLLLGDQSLEAEPLVHPDLARNSPDDAVAGVPPHTPGVDDDSSSIAELDHLMIPDPETSPVRTTNSSPLKPKLVDYASSSSGTPSRLATPSSDPRDRSLPPSSPIAGLVDPPEPPEPPPSLPDGDIDATLTDIRPHGETLDVSMEDDHHHPPSTPPKEASVHVPQDDEMDEESEQASAIPAYLRPYAVAPVEWDPTTDVKPPLLLRGTLRPYQQSGLEWLANLHTNNLNGILADEMGLGKTIQTIALLAHLACDRGIWGPHLIIVPTSVILNWEMEFKKFLPGFKVLAYHGGTTRRKELRKGWMDKFSFNVCITSYALASRDQHIFKRKNWNNLTELWALLQFLMSGSDFANLKEFGDWFSNPLEKAIEMGQTYDDETLQVVSKLHTVLRPYLLRRLKRDVEKELPSKFEHLLLCPLSKRQRFLYDEFMSRAQTKQDLESGVYQKIANILMQLRKVCNHPDLFEVRPIVTSFAMQRSAVADFEIKELLIRKRYLADQDEAINLGVLNLNVWRRVGTSHYAWRGIRQLDATTSLPYFDAVREDAPPHDTRTAIGFRRWMEYKRRDEAISRWSHVAYLNRLRCNEDSGPAVSLELLSIFSRIHTSILPLSKLDLRVVRHLDICTPIHAAVKSYEERAADMSSFVDRFAFATPPVVALGINHSLIRDPTTIRTISSMPHEFDEVLHRASVKLQIAFPDPSLLQFDCGKLQKLAKLLREKKEGGHRVLIFTQMTRVLDILEIFLNFHGYLYLRLDGATKIEDRQYITERFNADSRIFCFISSSRSGGVGIKCVCLLTEWVTEELKLYSLTGADTVVFYDSDFNPQMDRQCEDRAHRIGQIRDVHIYRLVSQHTVEEAMLRKADQKRSLDDIVIQKGGFDWSSLLNDENALTKALGEFEEEEDAHAAALAQEEAFVLEGANEADFGAEHSAAAISRSGPVRGEDDAGEGIAVNTGHETEEEGGTTVDYMVEFVERDWEFFRDWRI
ncbi:hypothetical protein NMY22_g329 [Coprinellus aureogranulatus]|nr:hypothetical protein NMY22_g329 [Coprinellus aureogranulatus]